MLTYKEEDVPLPSEETNVPHEEPAPQPSDEVASSTHEAPAPPPLPTKLDTDDLLVGNLYLISCIHGGETLLPSASSFSIYWSLFFGGIIQGLNMDTQDAAVIEERNALALAIVPSGQHSCWLYCFINLSLNDWKMQMISCCVFCRHYTFWLWCFSKKFWPDWVGACSS